MIHTVDIKITIDDTNPQHKAWKYKRQWVESEIGEAFDIVRLPFGEIDYSEPFTKDVRNTPDGSIISVKYTTK